MSRITVYLCILVQCQTILTPDFVVHYGCVAAFRLSWQWSMFLLHDWLIGVPLNALSTHWVTLVGGCGECIVSRCRPSFVFGAYLEDGSDLALSHLQATTKLCPNLALECIKWIVCSNRSIGTSVLTWINMDVQQYNFQMKNTICIPLFEVCSSKYKTVIF